MRRGIRKRILIGIFCCLWLFPGFLTQAGKYHDSNPDDYITRNFDVEIDFDEAHVATITETIKVDFRQSHHGITRNIPVAKDFTYEIKDISVDDDPFKVEKESNNTVIRIGSANTSITGEHTYVLHYKLQYYKDTDKSADFLAQNALPTEWGTSIRNAKVSLTMPKDMDMSRLQIYTGEYGNSDATLWQQYFKVSAKDRTITFKGYDLPKGYGLTLRHTDLTDGYWSEAISYMQEHRMRFWVIEGVAVFFALLAIFLWFKYGRDDKIVETVEFYPPEDMTPAEVGYAMDEELEDAEMMTMVFYLADKGYLSIESKGKHFVLHKEKEPGTEQPEYVRTFFNGMFHGRGTFSTKSVPASFRSPFDKSKEEVKGAYEAAFGEVFTSESCVSRYSCVLTMLAVMAAYTFAFFGFEGFYFAWLPGFMAIMGMIIAWKGFDNFTTKKGKGVFMILFGAILYGGGILTQIWFLDNAPDKTYLLVFGISEAIIFLFSLIMQKRSEKSTELAGKLYGFRTFIKEAEYDRIVALSEEDPEYFYHILPYAAVLGLETQWTKHFEKIKIPQPNWYRTEDTTFMYSAMWCSQIMHDCTKSAVPPTPSGGSSGGFSGGSSGGGFSGGGGGGGGGGAW